MNSMNIIEKEAETKAAVLAALKREAEEKPIIPERVAALAEALKAFTSTELSVDEVSKTIVDRLKSVENF